MKYCDGCKWCCYSFNVEVPREPRSLKVLVQKPENTHCHHECDKGCAVHDTFFQLPVCHDFKCPYLYGMPVHRPDTLQGVLMTGNMANYIPMVPLSMDAAEAEQHIRTTRTVPAAILLEGTWAKVILPLDRESDGSWSTNSDMEALWPNE